MLCEPSFTISWLTVGSQASLHTTLSTPLVFSSLALLRLSEWLTTLLFIIADCRAKEQGPRQIDDVVRRREGNLSSSVPAHHQNKNKNKDKEPSSTRVGESIRPVDRRGGVEGSESLSPPRWEFSRCLALVTLPFALLAMYTLHPLPNL